MPLFLSPTICKDSTIMKERLREAAEKFNTFYSMSTMATSSIEEVSNISEVETFSTLYSQRPGFDR